jgi:hypothetical protein
LRGRKPLRKNENPNLRPNSKNKIDSKLGLQGVLIVKPFALLAEEIDKEVLTEVLGSCIKSTPPVDFGDFLNKLHQVGILAEHKNIEADPPGGASLEFEKRFGDRLRMGRKLEENLPVFPMRGGFPI